MRGKKTADVATRVAVATSDWHGDGVTAGVQRYDDVERAARQVVDAAVRERAAAFLFLGDLTDPENVRSHRAVALAVRCATMLSAADVPSLWLTGNHDVVEDGSRTHTLQALKEIGGRVSVFDEPTDGYLPALDAHVVVLPFVEKARSYDAEAFVRDAASRVKKGRRALVLSHLTLPYLQAGSEGASMRRGRDVLLPVEAVRECLPGAPVLQGHYHKAQSTDLAGVKVHVPGSLVRLRFDEEHNRPGYLRCTFS